MGNHPPRFISQKDPVMTSHQEDPLEQLLDEQSDLDFGLPELKDRTQVLANWKAQDFSDIYIRFYPHLLRHAKRFLTNHSQAEEVVQDAFLYLMTSLPEIDSEIGVLKLLKWKVRNLALDVIKSESRANYQQVEELEIPVDHELTENLIRADDAAIVSLALAKLNPRQREALIANLYQGKDTAEVARDLALSENATRQLLFRAKAAFKKALIGEAETAGKSMAEILSIAARKAASESKKYVSAASALLLVLAISIGVIPNLPQNQLANVAIETVPTEPSQPVVPEQLQADVAEAVIATPVSNSSNLIVEQAEIKAVQPPLLSASFPADTSLGSSSAGFAYEFGADRDQLVRTILVYSEDLLSAKVDLVRVGESYIYELSNPRAELRLGNEQLVIKPGAFASSQIMSEDGQVLTLVSNDLKLLTKEGVEYLQQPLTESSLTILLELDLLGQVIAASVFIN